MPSPGHSSTHTRTHSTAGHSGASNKAHAAYSSCAVPGCLPWLALPDPSTTAPFRYYPAAQQVGCSLPDLIQKDKLRITVQSQICPATYVPVSADGTVVNRLELRQMDADHGLLMQNHRPTPCQNTSNSLRILTKDPKASCGNDRASTPSLSGTPHIMQGIRPECIVVHFAQPQASGAGTSHAVYLSWVQHQTNGPGAMRARQSRYTPSVKVALQAAAICLALVETCGADADFGAFLARILAGIGAAAVAPVAGGRLPALEALPPGDVERLGGPVGIGGHHVHVSCGTQQGKLEGGLNIRRGVS
jgi:hypothetical protein